MYLASAAGAGTTACSNGPQQTPRTITLHVPAACAVPDGAYARYFARGDFQPMSSAPAEDDITLSKANALLTDLPAAARSLVVDVSDDVDSHCSAWAPSRTRATSTFSCGRSRRSAV